MWTFTTLIPLVSLLSLVLADDKPCTVREGGQYFDLSKLSAQKEYTISLPNDGNISINVCKSLTHEVWNARVLNPEDIGASVQRKNSHGDFSLGYVNTTLQVKDGMPVLVYEKGTHCPDSENMRGSAIIRFICDKDVYGAGLPSLIAQYPSSDKSACAYVFTWKTHYACPTSESGWGGFGTFLYILFMGFLAIGLLYLCVGIWYRKYVLHRNGLDILPKLGAKSFSETFHFLKDALEDMFQRRSDPFDRYGSAWSGWRTNSTGPSARGGGTYGYDTVPATRDEESAILGEDSDEDEDAPPTPVQGARPGAGANPGARPGAAAHPGAPSPWNDQANVPQAQAQAQVQGSTAPRVPAASVAQPSQPPPPGMDASGTIRL